MFEAQFQSFEDAPEGAASAPRVAALRAELARRGLDRLHGAARRRHQNEYVPPSDERLAWLTGFTGSAGTAVVLTERAALFVDGRYTLQVRQQVDTALFAIEHLVENPPDQWLGAQSHRPATASAMTPGCTPPKAPNASPRPARRAARRWSRSSPIRSTRSGRTARHRRSARSCCTMSRFAGEEAATKLARIRAEIGKLKADALVVSDPHASPGPSTSAAPTSRIRRCRSPSRSCPREGRPALYVDGRKLSNDVRDALERSPICASPPSFAARLAALGAAQADRAARSGDRRRCARAADHRQRRQAHARPRSDRADEGGQERRRDRRRARRPHPRRRRGGALPRLVRPRGAGRQAHRDRRGRGAGKLSPRHRRAQGRLVSRPSRAPGRTAPSCITA